MNGRCELTGKHKIKIPIGYTATFIYFLGNKHFWNTVDETPSWRKVQYSRSQF